ncbi:hypothetical protein MASR2M44_20810 [Bacteroidota bacterium]
MKQVFSFALAMGLIFSSIPLLAQQNCCAVAAAPTAFAGLTKDRGFVNSHTEPLPYTLDEHKGKDINLKSASGNQVYVYEVSANSNSKKVVFVIHEWWGLNDYIRHEADKIQEALGNDVRVIALDLYDNKVATTRDSAAKYMQSVKAERALEIIQTAINYAGPKAQIATIGWCFGGGWSLQSSLAANKQTKACVMYYGMPEENVERLKTLRAPVLFVWPTQDQWINKQVVDKFKVNMKNASKNLEVLSYEADHAFANPSNPNHKEDFAKDAFEKAMNFIRKGFEN